MNDDIRIEDKAELTGKGRGLLSLRANALSVLWFDAVDATYSMRRRLHKKGREKDKNSERRGASGDYEQEGTECYCL